MKVTAISRKALMACLFCVSPVLYPADINPRVANAYNEGIVRCSNPECARYLYACFRSFAASSLDEFLACGSQASRLNGNEFVVSTAGQTAQRTQ